MLLRLSLVASLAALAVLAGDGVRWLSGASLKPLSLRDVWFGLHLPPPRLGSLALELLAESVLSVPVWTALVVLALGALLMAALRRRSELLL